VLSWNYQENLERRNWHAFFWTLKSGYSVDTEKEGKAEEKNLCPQQRTSPSNRRERKFGL
jgi:hypothetical protein